MPIDFEPDKVNTIDFEPDKKTDFSSYAFRDGFNEDYQVASDILPMPLVKGLLKSVVTVPATFMTMGGTFPAAGIKGYSTYISETLKGSSIDDALQKATDDIHEFTNRIPDLLITTPEEKKAMELLGLPFEYLEKLTKMSGEGWEELSAMAMGKDPRKHQGTYVAPVVATVLNAFFLGKIGDLFKDAAKAPVRLAEIREGGKRVQKWIDEGADPIKQPKPVSEIGNEIKPPIVTIQNWQEELAQKNKPLAPEFSQKTPSPVSSAGTSETPGQVPIVEAAKPKGKEPWEMTKEEAKKTLTYRSAGSDQKNIYHGTKYVGKSTFSDKPIEDFHYYEIKKAIREGKPVPPEVLKDYPDLAKKTDVLQGEVEPEIFIRGIKKSEKGNPTRSLSEIPDKEGYDKVYKPYGMEGKGFYYVEKPTTPTAASVPKAASPDAPTRDIPAQEGLGQAEIGAKGIKSGIETPSDIVQLADSLKELNSPQLPLSQRISNALNISDTLSSAKDVLGKGLDKIRLGSETLYNDIKSGDLGKPKDITEFETQREKYTGSYQITNLEAKRFGATIRKQIPDPIRREAIVNWIQADGDINLLKRQYEQSLNTTHTSKYADGYKKAMELTNDEKIFAQNVNNYFESKLQKGIDAGLLETGLSDYVNQLWKRDNPISNKFKTDISLNRLQPNPSIIKHRIFEDYFAGEQAGYKPTAKDIGHLLSIYDQSFNKAIASRNFIRSLANMDAGDGNPVIGRSGAASKIESKIQDGDVYLIRPRAQGENYDGYKVIDHPALRKWRWVGQDEMGNPIMLQADALVHPDVYNKLNVILKTSAIRQNPAGRAVLSTVATLKGTLLSLSGFHQTQVGLHALFHGVNPFTTPKLDLSIPLQRSLVESGLVIADYKNMELFHEGITSGGLIGKVPGLGTVAQKYTDWLFTEYIPRLKMKMATEAYGRNTERYQGKLTDAQIKSLTADQGNAAFGELNYAKLGRDPTTQDVLRLMLLAPDFFEARARFVGQAVRPYAGLGKTITPNEQGMAAVVRGGLGLYLGARIVNAILNDGNTHTDKPFSIIIGEDEFVLRSIPGDVVHLVNDPRSFVYHRLNPTITLPIMKGLLKRDDTGHYIAAEDWVKEFFLSHTPIPLQGSLTGQKKIWESVLSSMGVSAFKYRTNYERALIEETSKFITVTSSKEDRERNKIVSKYVEEIQTGIKKGDNNKLDEVTANIQKDLLDKKLFMEDTDKIFDYALSDRVEQYMKTLPIERILLVWNKATSDEKMKYLPILLERITNLMDDHPEKLDELMPEIRKVLEDMGISI